MLAADEAGPDPDTGLDARLPLGAEDPPRASYVLRVNGADRPVSEAWIGESLLYVLRERLGLAGAKDGCEQGECGACSVQVDGQLVDACLVPAALAQGCEVHTVEGLSGTGAGGAGAGEDPSGCGTPTDVQRALAASGAVQCGFCSPGLVMALHDLLDRNHQPTDLEIRQSLSGNLCRCSGYQGALAAARRVSAVRRAAAESDAQARRDAAGAKSASGARGYGHAAGGSAGSGQADDSRRFDDRTGEFATGVQAAVPAQSRHQVGFPASDFREDDFREADSQDGAFQDPGFQDGALQDPGRQDFDLAEHTGQFAAIGPDFREDFREDVGEDLGQDPAQTGQFPAVGADAVGADDGSGQRHGSRSLGGLGLAAGFAAVAGMRAQAARDLAAQDAHDVPDGQHAQDAQTRGGAPDPYGELGDTMPEGIPAVPAQPREPDPAGVPPVYQESAPEAPAGTEYGGGEYALYSEDPYQPVEHTQQVPAYQEVDPLFGPLSAVLGDPAADEQSAHPAEPGQTYAPDPYGTSSDPYQADPYRQNHGGDPGTIPQLHIPPGMWDYPQPPASQQAPPQQPAPEADGRPVPEDRA
jgi:aerobic-type carbon monoxide dehydrogenase small subunit (CoxS/CutS family)